MRIWLSDLTRDQQVIAADTMPTNVAYLASYVCAKTKGEHEFRLFKYPDKLITALIEGNLPEIVGFSHFIWNSELSLRLAGRIRRLKPDVIIVFGGLHYPSDPNLQRQWLQRHSDVDFYVYKEGENGLLSLVNALSSGANVEDVKADGNLEGVHYVRPNGDVHLGPPAERVSDLSMIPSPYLSGLLDEFFDGRLMPVLTTNRGCPFTCTFCSEGTRYYTKVHRSTLERVADEIDYIASKIADFGPNARRDLYISDSNFGMFENDIEVAKLLRTAQQTYGWPEYIQTTTGKNNKECVLRVADLLEGSLRLSGSVQSLDPTVQENIKRTNIRADELLDVALKAGAIGANSYSEVILGLPVIH